MALSKEIKTYGLKPNFERIIAEMCSARPSFWGRIGHEIDPDRIGDAAAKLVIQACKAIAIEAAPPSSPVLVEQRLQTWHLQGQLGPDDLAQTQELLECAMEDAHIFNEDGVVAELAPTLRRTMEKHALETGFQVFAKRGDMKAVEALLARAKRIGAADISVGSKLVANSIPNIIERSKAARLSTGLKELDAILAGGIKRATFTVVTGSTGTGKSMFIDHFVANAIASTIPCAIATLELSEEAHHARLIGNLVDLPYEDILTYPDVAETAMDRMRQLEEDGLLAFCTVKYFTARATTVADIDRWLAAEEQVHGVKIQVLGIDYGQLLAAEKTEARHSELTLIAEDLRKLAIKRDLWLICPNQANAEGMDARKTKVLQNHHSADSKGIPKTADLHITLNPRDDGTAILFHVAKNRNGPTGEDAGPLMHEFEKGRIGPIHGARDGWPF